MKCSIVWVLLRYIALCPGHFIVPGGAGGGGGEGGASLLASPVSVFFFLQIFVSISFTSLFTSIYWAKRYI